MMRAEPPLVRILITEKQNVFSELIALLTHESVAPPAIVMMVQPPTCHEEDLLKLAVRQKFDAAILIYNNIIFASGARGRAVDEWVVLTEKMHALLRRPIIGVHGFRLDAEEEARLRRAGAMEVFSLPWENNSMLQAVKRCLAVRR